ncbi:MAG: type I restriction endonuclease subunit R [Planctomycetes bacterium]|nr:type I restriction endonuclease subunit R [Planctomycetota bacterium]
MSEHAPDRTPAYHEDDLSQIPALLLLSALGYEYLSPQQALVLRGGRESQVLLVDVLARKLRDLNRVRVRGEEHPFTEAAIAEAVRRLRDVDQGDGLMRTNEAVWELLRFGVAQDQVIAGDRKSHNLRYIDWERPENNAFHVTEELSVSRTASDATRRPDLVLYVNGIPFAVIECKRPGIKDPLAQAVSQQIGYQRDDEIPRLYLYAQLLFALAVDQASYATVGTAARFWAVWKEAEGPELLEAVNTPLPTATRDQLFGWRLHGARDREYLEHLEDEGGRGATEQDRLLWALARPKRLLDLASKFTVFDAGERKVARYQQYRCVEKAMARIAQRDEKGRRLGGIVWHTQGSGKSLTMVMLAEAIFRDPTIAAPKIVLVTDRVDLDDQIYGAFKHCGADLRQATTGQNLLELLADPRTRIVTTLIHKFQSAVEMRGAKVDSPDVFVLVDESHRTNFGTLHASMKRVLPGACLIGFTGTPVRKADRDVLQRFGGFIDQYTIDEAVKDKAVVPLLYEGRHVLQSVDAGVIDSWFERTVKGLSPEQAVDLKKKFSTANQLNRTEQKIMAVAWDISEHFAKNWQGTGFKAQLTAPSKADALLYKKHFDQFGKVSTAVLISAPDQREGHEEVDKVSDAAERPDVGEFWAAMMKRFGTEEQYQKRVIEQFKGDGEPEILIVVDKLLTGFDAPRNTVLYIARSLKEHTLLQAIARVNRLYEGKDFGYVVDYYGVLRKLGDALDMFGSFDGEFDERELGSGVVAIEAEIAELPQRHSDVWAVFKSVKRKHDREEVLAALAAEEARDEFYSRLTAFARTLQVALSCADYLERTDGKQVARYKTDLKYFVDLRVAAQRRYAESVDFKQYQTRIQKLLDTHVKSGDIEIVVQPVSIFDREAFQREVDKLDSDRSKALTIANRVRRAITDHQAEDPALYKRFSELLSKAIEDFHQQRIDDAAFLSAVRSIAERVRDRAGDAVPGVLDGRDVAKAYFGIAVAELRALGASDHALAELALAIDVEVSKLRIVNWVQSQDQQNRMRQAIEDATFAWGQPLGLSLPFERVDNLIEGCLGVARVRVP